MIVTDFDPDRYVGIAAALVYKGVGAYVLIAGSRPTTVGTGGAIADAVVVIVETARRFAAIGIDDVYGSGVNVPAGAIKDEDGVDVLRGKPAQGIEHRLVDKVVGVVSHIVHAAVFVGLGRVQARPARC